MKNQEIITIEHKEVKITVKIDYDYRQLSLVEQHGRDYVPKKWMFAEREIEYTRSWLTILDAMQTAISHCNAKLEAHIEEQDKQAIERVDVQMRDLSKAAGVKLLKNFGKLK